MLPWASYSTSKVSFAPDIMRVQTSTWLAALPMRSPTIECGRQARGQALRLFRMLSHRVTIIVVLYGTAYRIRM